MSTAWFCDAHQRSTTGDCPECDAEMIALADEERCDRVMIPGYFIAPDAWGDLWVWRERGDYPVPILAHRDMRDDPELWDVLAKAVGARG